MKILRFLEAEPFVARSGAWLERREAANALLYGVALRVLARATPEKEQAYMALVEESGGEIVLAALMTPPHRLILSSEVNPTPKAYELLADDLLAGKWNVPGVVAALRLAEGFAETWKKRTGIGWKAGKGLRAFELHRVAHRQTAPGDMRLACEDDLDLVTHWTRAFQEYIQEEIGEEEARTISASRIEGGHIFLWVNGGPVSMAMKNRPTPHGISVSLVYTPPGERCKGYAGSLVARLSQHLLDAGNEYCALFTDTSNPTSNHIYQEIGYQAVEDFREILFDG